MNDTQRKLARHALGLDEPAARGKSYRNRYTAGNSTRADIAWQGLVAQGLARMVLVRRGDAAGRYTNFWLTEAGAKAALEQGERLCPEDFPQTKPRPAPEPPAD